MAASYLVYLRKATLENVPAQRIAAACRLSRADVDRLIHSRMPQAALVYSTEDAARRAVEALRASGLDAFATTFDALRAFEPVPIRRVSRGPEGLSWWGDSFCIPPHARIRMVVTGKVAGEARTTGATPRGAAQRVAPGRGEESFCCLIESVRAAAIVYESTFDFASLLPRLEPTRTQNFLKLVEAARLSFLEAAFDDRLYRFPAAAKSLSGTWAPEAGMADVGQTSLSGRTSRREVALACLIYLEAGGAGT